LTYFPLCDDLEDIGSGERWEENLQVLPISLVPLGSKAMRLIIA
jgi:hypothetical protein